MTIFAQTCTFPGSAPINATLGWDVVYAVDYDTINADLAARKPWMIDFGGIAIGTFDQTSGSGNLLDAQISQIRFVTGGTGRTVQMALDIASAELNIGSDSTNLTNIVAAVQCSLAFVASPGVTGLHNLSVDTSNLNVTGVTSSPVLPAPDAIILQTLLQIFVADKADIFSGIYANVFTKDYAESVNIPWLLPAAFDYAVADKINPTSPTDGILAVLGSISGDVANLSPQVEPLMFPTNAGVNAAVAISAQVVENNTFLTQFNAQASTAASDFVFNPQANALFNQNTISAYYRIDSVTQQVSLIPAGALADGSGVTYPFTIPIGGLEFTLSPNSITANINNGVVDLGKGYSLTLQMTTSYQLIVDADQNIDLVLSGTPQITSSVSTSAQTSAGDIAVEFASTALSIIGGEFIAFAIDKLTGFATSTAMSNATVVDLTTRFFAAERQLGRNPGAAVVFSIKGWRTVTLGRVASDFDQPAVQLSDAYIDSVTLRRTYPFEDNSDPNSSQNTLVGSNSDFSYGVAKIVLDSIAGNAGLVASLKSYLAKSGYEPASAWASDGRGVNFPPTQDYATLASLYEGCANFVIDKVNSGQLSYTVYNSIITNFYKSAVSGGGALYGQGGSILDPSNGGGLIIRTSTGGGTDVVGGLLGDIEWGAATGRAGVLAALFKDIILNTERPILVKFAGILLYLAGLAGGYFFGQWAGNLGSAQSKAEQKAADILNGGPSGPSALLFSSVTFPFMTRFSSGSEQGPVPANVLQCAAVNGGLILGVAIAINQ